MNRHESSQRIYLDNSATSWPKPETVYQAVERYQRDVGAPAGRSSYAEAAAVSKAVADVRTRLARLFNVDDPSRIIFTLNGTDALNQAIHGLLREGDHVVTTVVEHNSVLRPLAYWEDRGAISVTRVGCDPRGIVDPDTVHAAMRANTRLVAICHASNVTGALQPVPEIGRFAHQGGALVLCDAAQTAGHVPIDMRALEVDLLAMPGHKGLLGPLGTGVLALGPRVAEQLNSVRQGGTGTQSQSPRQPDELPEKYESGNLNVPGILGLGAAVEYLDQRGLDDVERHGRQLIGQLLAGFAELLGVRICGPPNAELRVPLVSIVVEGYDPQEVAVLLDSAYRIQVRAGLHCAPLMHEALGTAAGGGTVRFSLGAFTTPHQIDAAVRAVAELTAAEVPLD